MHTPWTQTSGGPETQWMYVYKTDKWILLHTGTVVTPREVYNCLLYTSDAADDPRVV